MYDFFVDLFCGNKSSSQKKNQALQETTQSKFFNKYYGCDDTIDCQDRNV